MTELQSLPAAMQDREAAGPQRSRHMAIFLIFILRDLVQVAQRFLHP